MAKAGPPWGGEGVLPQGVSVHEQCLWLPQESARLPLGAGRWGFGRLREEAAVAWH